MLGTAKILMDGMFKDLSAELSPKLAMLYRLLFKKGSFPEKWKLVISPKGAASTASSDYRLISILPCVFKVFEKLI